MNLIVKVLSENEMPKKKMKKGSRVKEAVRTIYESLSPGQIAQINPKAAGVNAFSLRWELRRAVVAGYYSADTKIVSRGKEWFFQRGK